MDQYLRTSQYINDLAGTTETRTWVAAAFCLIISCEATNMYAGV
jgi:hypothetical protein